MAMSDVRLIEPLVCGNCKHFEKGPVDPNNIGAVRHGDCLEGPPTPCMVVVPSPQGPVMQKITTYPQVHEKFKACGKYQSVVAIGGDVVIDKDKIREEFELRK